MNVIKYFTLDDHHGPSLWGRPPAGMDATALIVGCFDGKVIGALDATIVRALKGLLNYCWDEERVHFESEYVDDDGNELPAADSHIFHSIRALQQTLDMFD